MITQLQIKESINKIDLDIKEIKEIFKKKNEFNQNSALKELINDSIIKVKEFFAYTETLATKLNNNLEKNQHKKIMNQIKKLRSNFLLYEKEFNENLSIIFRLIENPEKFEYEKNLADFRFRKKRTFNREIDLNLEDILNIKNKNKIVNTDSKDNKNRDLLLAFSSSSQSQDQKGAK